MPYSSGAISPSACTCDHSYYWDETTGHCLSSKSDSAASIAVGITVPLAVLGLIALVGLVWVLGLDKMGNEDNVSEVKPIAQPFSTVPVGVVPATSQSATSMTRLVAADPYGYILPVNPSMLRPAVTVPHQPIETF